MWDNGGRLIFSPGPDYEDLILQRQEEIEIAEDTADDYCVSSPDARCPYQDPDCSRCPYANDYIW